MGSNILLISEDKNFARLLASKLVFLRNDDVISISDYGNALCDVEINKSEIVLLHENPVKNITLDLIKKLREKRNLCIILLASCYNQDLILAAYDAGIDDFALSSAEDFELVIRIVNNIKHNSVKITKLREEKILEQLQVIDSLTGFYSYKYCKQIIENNIIDNENKIFMAVSVSNSYKSRFSTERFALAVKNSIRVDDIIFIGKGTAFYILLSKTDVNGAIVVLNKIKENYGNDFEIRAGVSILNGDNFNMVEYDTLEALSEATAKNSEYEIVDNNKDETLDEWLGDSNLKDKNYKFFKQMFNKKLEKVITPVFYSLQKAWEDKLYGTEIEQYANMEQCVFRLKNRKQDSTLRIVYPGFAKIIISITHQGLDSPENTEEQVLLSKVTQKELVKRVEDFIKTFRNSL